MSLHHTYSLPPIDYGWEMLPLVEDVAAQLAHDDVLGARVGDVTGQLPAFLERFEEALGVAKLAGWEGDFRQGCEPRVFWLPDEDGFSYAFAWKQDNNGTVFVLSPQPLPWLRALSFPIERA